MVGRYLSRKVFERSLLLFKVGGVVCWGFIYLKVKFKEFVYGTTIRRRGKLS